MISSNDTIDLEDEVPEDCDCDTTDLPPIKVYKIVDYHNLSKYGAWWSCIMLLRDNKRRVFLSFYKFHKERGKWRKKLSYRINNINTVKMMYEGLVAVEQAWRTTLIDDEQEQELKRERLKHQLKQRKPQEKDDDDDD